MSEDSKKINQKPVSPPDDCDKPFFTYGIFKKGQIAHSKIADYVDCVEEGDDVEISGELKIRDGFPLIGMSSGSHTIKGQIMRFCDEYEGEAYQKISDTMPEDLYGWGDATVKGMEVNILFGKHPDKGAFTYETDGGIYVDTFDGKDDLFFSSEFFEFLRSESESLCGNREDIFRLQMCYMLLWSAIDRYCTLKYDSVNFKGDDLENLSKDPVFIESINECDLQKHKSIHSTRNAKPWKWRNSPFSKLYFYYRLRGNVVHRGKDRNNNIGILHQCLDELVDIFEKVIDKTFSER